MNKNEFNINENRVLYKLKNVENAIENFEKATKSLTKSLEPELVKMAIIQYYEISVEVTHSFLVKYLQSLGENITTDTAKKVVIRKMVANVNFDESKALILYKSVDIRNRTSHEYKDWYSVYGKFIVIEYLPAMKELIKFMKNKI